MNINALVLTFTSLIVSCAFAGQGITLPLNANITLPQTSQQLSVQLSKNNKILHYDDKLGSFKSEVIDVMVTRTSEGFDKYSIELAQNSSTCDNGNDISVDLEINGIVLSDSNKVEFEFSSDDDQSEKLLLLNFSKLEKDDESYSCEGYITLLVSALN